MILPVARNARRSTALAPASLSISAEISPVNAPARSAWQSCAPIATPEPRAREAKVAIRVAGGQTRRSVPGIAAAPAIMRSSSATAAKSPFIFQFPATSGRRPPPMRISRIFVPSQPVSRRVQGHASAVFYRPLLARWHPATSVAAEGGRPYDGVAFRWPPAARPRGSRSQQDHLCFEVYAKRRPTGSARPSWPWSSACWC